MALYLCDQNFQRTHIIEGYNSFTWTDRYTEAGDFQLKCDVDSPLTKLLNTKKFLAMDGSKRHMVIENYVRDGDKNTITYSGRDLRCLLERRANWYALQKQSDNKDATRHGINTVARDMVYLSVIAPTDGFNKTILGNDYLPWGATPGAQRDYSTENVYDAIAAMCTEAEVGFELEYFPEFTPNGGSKVYDHLVFYLRMGVDRSLGQDQYPKVVFDPRLDNIAEVSEVKSLGGVNIVYIIDESAPSGYVRMQVAGYPVDPYNLEARTAIYKPTEEDLNGFSGSEINTYRRYLAYKAQRKHRSIHVMDGKILADSQYTYGFHYALGDIVSIGQDPLTSQRGRVTEYIWSHDENGVNEYPTFKVTETL